MRQTIRTRRAALATTTVLSLVAAALWTAPSAAAQAEARFTPGNALAEASPLGVNLVYNDANVGVLRRTLVCGLRFHDGQGQR